MLGLSFDTVRTVAVVAVGILLIGAVVSVILLRTIAQKLAVAAILGLVALLIWTQRSALETCADLIREGAAGATCTFFGRDVDIPTRPGT